MIFVEDQKRAEILKDEICFFSPQSSVEILNAYDVLPYYGLSPHRQTVLHTQKILWQLAAKKIDFLIVPKLAALKRLVPKKKFEALCFKIVKNDLIDRDDFLKKLESMGYTRESVVEEFGDFAVRGDIIDIFSPAHALPSRLSFFDIEVEDIKFFDPQTQRAGESQLEVSIIPIHEILFPPLDNWQSVLKKRADRRDILKSKRDRVEELIENKIHFHGIEFFLPLFYSETGSLFDYMPAGAVVFDELPQGLSGYARENISHLEKSHAESEHIESIFSPDELFLCADEVVNRLENFSYVQHTQNPHDDEVIFSGHTESNLELRAKITSQIAKIHSLEPLALALNQKRVAGISCFICCQNELQRDRIRDLLSRFDLPVKSVEELHRDELVQMSLENMPSERLIHLVVGKLHEGFFSQELRQWWITDEEIFGKKIRRTPTFKKDQEVFNSFSQLTEGDFLIHIDHGIGVYRGLVKLEYDKNKNDFVLIEYLGQDKLYVPIAHLNRVQRFAAEEGATPQLDKLGGSTWLKTRAKAKKAARKMAKELLDLQAAREALVGHAFAANNEMMEEFSANFEFEETPDQLRAIEESFRDMRNTRPMDRLICGDVGYGKTEIALRATFKAVADHKQVAVLVPTTVLAFQHFNNFRERFKNYGLNIDLLSRFRSAPEQKKTVEKIRQGTVDIVIGTHRLLSEDIKFQDLGLLIVDEEHRFGVVHKEKIKKLKNLVDVMTLTATPIPRTLNFALNGIRDLSIINTPPLDRLAVKTYACNFDEVTIRDAILKEIRRGGQVYFVHNRVQLIEKITTQLQKLVPEARIRFGHGQLLEEDLEKTMVDFVNHDFDVLVCTTIIESGLDIPNTNTMIINHADTFGLAQLYQLRGRVGRSHHQAYCYLIIPDEVLITNKARKRLAVIQKFTELGSGFKVASHDLEIRGAGNILGDEQSGHIAAVGYDLYCHLLQEAVNELKNAHMPEEFEPEIKLNIAAKIPDGYVSDTQLRLVLYKQLSACETFEETEVMLEDWLDRFGKIPEEVKNLMGVFKIKILCKKVLVSGVKQNGDGLSFSFHPSHQLDPQIFLTAVKNNPNKSSITRDGQFVMRQKFASEKEVIEAVLGFLTQIDHTTQVQGSTMVLS